MSATSLALECDETTSRTFKRCFPNALPMSSPVSSIKKRRRLVVETTDVSEEPEISSREMEDFLILKQTARENRSGEAMSIGESMTKLTAMFALEESTIDFGSRVQRPIVKAQTSRRRAARVCGLHLRWQFEANSKVAIQLVDFLSARGGSEGIVEGVHGPVGARCFCDSEIGKYKAFGMCLKHTRNFMRLRDKFFELLFQKNNVGFDEWLSEHNLQHQE